MDAGRAGIDTPYMTSMAVFSGIARFSPFVSKDIQHIWASNGGVCAQTKEERARAVYFFCAGLDDPWVPELLARSIVAFHATWIVKSTEEGVAGPMRQYILDDAFDATCVPSTLPSESPPARRLPLQDVFIDSNTRRSTLSDMALRKKRRLSSYPTPSPNARQQRPTKKQRVMQKPVIKFNSKKDNIHADEPDKLAQETDATLQKYRNDETEDLEDERRVEAELSAIYPPVLPTTTTPNRHADLWAPYLRRSEHRLPISIAHVLNVLQVEHRIGLEDESMLFEHGTTWKDASFAVRGRAAW